MRGIRAPPGFDGVDGRYVATVFLHAVEEEVVIIDHAGRHFDLIVAATHTERPADGKAVGKEVIRGMLGDVVHGHKRFEGIAYIQRTYGGIAVEVGDGDSDAMEGCI